MKRIILLVPLALLLLFGSAVKAQTLTQGEYFYDTDPGVGHGTAVSISTPADSINLNLALPVSSLSNGWHYLYFRFRDSQGIWGLNTTQSFYIVNSSIDTNANSSPKISAAEYFFDTDPGVGLGTAFNSFTAADSVNVLQNIPTGSLGAGYHYLYARFKYSNGVWGNPNLSQSFYISTGTVDTAANSSPKINQAEYFFDTDPGEGNGTAFSAFTSADSVNITQNVPVGSLSQGFHYLYSRFGYTNGVWGLPTSASFFIINPATQDTSPPINYVEYFFDTDPGVGNGHGSAVAPATDSANLLLNVTTAGLSSGQHVLFMRFRYNNGVWGLYQQQGDTLTVCNPPVATISANGPASFCTGGSVTLNSDTSHLYHYQWQRNGVNLANDTLSTLHITDSSGVYSIVIDSANCPGNSNSITVAVNAPTSYTYSQNICQGQSLSFGGRTLTTTGTYHDTLSNAHNCDSIVTLNLTVSSSIQANITAAVCPGDSFAFNGRYYSQAGTYRDTATGNGGCDSITTLALSLYASPTTHLTGSICQGSSYSFNGRTLDTGGVYKDTLSSVHGCDSIVILTLAEYFAVRDSINAHICQGNLYPFGGHNIDTEGVYTDTLQSAHGCDSIVVLTLAEYYPAHDTINDTICQGQSFSFNEQNITAAGSYNETLTTVNGCDSIVTLQLAVTPLPVVSLSWNAMLSANELRLMGTDTVDCWDNTSALPLTGGSPGGGSYSGTSISGDTLYGYNGVDGITYTVSQNGCSASATDSLKLSICEGVNEIALENLVSIYPNPATDLVTLQCSLFATAQVTPMMYDVTGKQVIVTYIRQADKITFNTGVLSSGLYLIQFNINGTKLNKRFVKTE